MVSRSVNSSGDQLKSTYCLSQLRVTFISRRIYRFNRRDSIHKKTDKTGPELRELDDFPPPFPDNRTSFACRKSSSACRKSGNYPQEIVVCLPFFCVRLQEIVVRLQSFCVRLQENAVCFQVFLRLFAGMRAIPRGFWASKCPENHLIYKDFRENGQKQPVGGRSGGEVLPAAHQLVQIRSRELLRVLTPACPNSSSALVSKRAIGGELGGDTPGVFVHDLLQTGT